MPRLTDTQLVILSAAAGRDDGTVLPLPISLKVKGGAALRLVKSLLKRGLVAEQPASPGAAAWRETKDGQPFVLVLTDAGRTAIGLEVAEPATATTRSRKRRRESKRSTTVKAKPKRKQKMASLAAARPGTKQALLLDLLQRKQGATIAEAVKATGWQTHSVRGAISGTLKKKLGFTVDSAAVEGRGRVYRIVACR
jgi:hypothetical protein